MVSPPDPDPEPPTAIGRYQVRRRIGAGAMGVVHAAYDPQLGREVALKLLRSAALPDDARLRAEARAMAQVSDPAVVHVYEVGQHDGRPFIAMELVAGVTLREWSHAERPRWRACLDALVTIGGGLAAAHEAGVVHGDVKPDNILVARGGRVCISDFGLAAIGAGREVVGGTPAYMAPELHAGRTATTRSDQFSFAVTCWELLYRERPFVGGPGELPTSLAVATEIIVGRRRPPPAHIAVPGFVRATIGRALAPDPDARWCSMRDMVAAFAAGARRRRSMTVVALAGGIAGVAATAAAGATVWAYTRPGACAVSGAAVTSVWNDDAARQVARSFSITRRLEAARTADGVRTKLDRWSTAWSIARTATCDAELTVAERDRRERCLDRGLDALRARVAVLVDADGAVVDRAREISELPDPSACAAPGGAPRPADPSISGVVASLERDHDRGYAEFLAGRLAGALPRAVAAARAAALVGVPAAVSDAERLVGLIAFYTSDVTTAEPAFRRAIAAAVEGRDDARAARAWSDLVAASAGARRTAALEEGILALRTAVARIDDPALQIEALATIGVAQHRLGRAAEAVATCKQALARADHELHPSAMAYNQARRCLQLIYYELGQITDGLPLAAARAAWCERYYGADHPFTADALTQQAELLGYLGREIEALALQRRALDITLRVHGPDSIETARARTAMADALATARGRNPETTALLEQAIPVLERRAPEDVVLAGSYDRLAHNYGLARLDDAIALYRKAIAGFARQPVPYRHKLVAVARNNLAELLQQADRCPEAIVELEASIAGFREVPGLAAWWGGAPLVLVGECQRALGRVAEAVATLERAHQLLAAPDAQVSVRVNADVKLAELLWSSRRDRPRAIALLSATCATFAEMGPGMANNRAECEAQAAHWRRDLAAPGR